MHNRKWRDYVVSIGVVEYGEHNIGISNVPGRACISPERIDLNRRETKSESQ